ncbi:DegT/DnrJ/EryC1/StrS family aminotransferase [Magnetospirillum gryphiswaldense]|uniref:DegT/DnrJ/EryC1/StrS aminotransferase n=1 Tax=Magnetospirillum gryphiswaldense TaxID=55518 RepID=A4TUX2_9PROT|nr:DegT/DnrJ/EryC1/StrS family aminotransferase [Magnetospirillum gryphiswaldense]AVM76374.1 UDP-4-amino-4-deoxy-L-arabinose--oxoglutarate aminotransferase [Magnetospirillum gryphiswaldense MSR-1]AVM80277.1 UDP-4-amino-4-deoxy-L-arabinose--oxoglutarate aminotransferase [Magnetospirillum gryphiswaldense]CAM74429.1 DegT/DnrJ/EryC1/StrS aminotransferase [Magnetospirillum gryphiswaldense MSR-1]
MSMIPITRPETGDAEIAAATRVLRSGWLTQGPEVAAFETEFAALVGSPHACAVANCTNALHLALLALGIGHGDEVATVSHSFIATANAVRYVGAEPVFVDIDATTLGMDAAALATAITPRTRAVLVVHQVGMPCDLSGLLAVASAHGLPIIEDAACALGSEIRLDGAWQWIGRPAGRIACFSFHPRKVISCGEGGMLTTADPTLDARFRLLRQHGMTVPDTARHGAAQVIFEQYAELGYNYRMTDLQAAVGREQLRRLPWILERRRHLAQRYHTELGQRVPSVTLAVQPPWARSNWQSYPVWLPAGCDQRAVMQAMLDAGIATRRGIMNAHREPPYGGHAWTLPVSEAAQDRIILLPLFPALEEADQDRVVTALAAALA